jgi:RNA polymerase sigma-70 factor (ECF subfamily)
MLGSAAEAEDVVQDAYLRYAAAPREEVHSPRSYLSTVVNRLCLDRLKSGRARREQYVGPWLPEPVVTSGRDDDPFRDVEKQETVTLAFLRVLEALSPAERAVFLLREVFEYPYEEIAGVLELTPANCRQLFHRAKEHVQRERPRFAPAPERQQQLIERFLQAIHGGGVHAFEALLAQDVTFHSDGGGKVSAARKPIYGAHAVARFLFAVAQLALECTGFTMAVESVNGAPALVFWNGEQLDTIYALQIADDQITSIEAIRNPDKLTYAAQQLKRQAASGKRQAASVKP